MNYFGDLAKYIPGLEEMILSMMKEVYRLRPSSAQVLSTIDSWDITVNKVQLSKTYQKNVNQLKQFSNKFFNNYFEYKFK